MKWYTPYLLGLPLILWIVLTWPVQPVSYRIALPHGNSHVEASHCLISTVYFEARDQPIKGQKAVAQVIHNRAKASGQDYCQVVTSSGQFTAIRGKALEITLDKQARPVFKSAPDVKAWLQIKNFVEKGLYKPSHKNLVKGSTFYATNHVKPYWARDMRKVVTIGDHSFYKPRG